jgi:hypothetical protein
LVEGVGRRERVKLNLVVCVPVSALHAPVANLLRDLNTQHQATLQTACNGLSTEELAVLNKMIQHVMGSPSQQPQQ